MSYFLSIPGINDLTRIPAGRRGPGTKPRSCLSRCFDGIRASWLRLCLRSLVCENLHLLNARSWAGFTFPSLPPAALIWFNGNRKPEDSAAMARIQKTVFISYRRTNLPWALAIWQNLTHYGYDVFIDYDGLKSGEIGRASCRER